MPEPGGPTTQSGILFQNRAAVLWLGRLLDLRLRCPSPRAAVCACTRPTAAWSWPAWALAEGDRDAAGKSLAAARRIVEETGYARRAPEVAALEQELAPQLPLP
jgi:hypothetical protein